jgi:hypothetical protein
MTADYGHFAKGSSTSSRKFRSGAVGTVATNMSQKKTPATGLPQTRRNRAGSIAKQNQLTPSFFCRLDDEVVYWNTSRLSG